MNFTELNSENQIESILIQSDSKPVLIYKHSPYCHVSSAVQMRLSVGNLNPSIQAYRIEVYNNKEVSQRIANLLRVAHQSPQILLIYRRQCVLNKSQDSIDIQTIQRELTKLTLKA